MIEWVIDDNHFEERNGVSLIGKLTTFVRSPTGQKLVKEAEQAAKNPKIRAKAEAALGKLTKR